ncbi:MAG TPA: hydantoinase/oxoprolinase family protein [Thermomicrobiales bacterium]|nr:hydantoinase/oxoprolinase family protein [Thermomicrobiales bacterium]
MASGRLRVGVDIGGTFTDLIAVDEETGALHVGKTLTTPDHPARGVEAGLRETLAGAGRAPADVAGVIHGTTLVTNALIERTGAPTALLATRGHRDAVEIRREGRYDLYDLFLELPPPLAPRRRRLEVDERVLADGTVAAPLDPAQIPALVARLRDLGVEAVAVSLLNSYRNPDHERLLGAALADLAPELTVSLSSEVVPEIGEYERTSTTLANVYVRPLVERYLAGLVARLRDLGVADAPLLVMLSSGGTATVETARRFPIRLVESGPAAGALAAAHYGGLTGRPDLLSFDMGGTTAKACLIDRGEPLVAADFEVARVYRFKRGSGLPVRVPVIEMIEIGAGGGSIARVDGLGLLKVGPDSAGADPGPACYGRGGAAPTVTDADLLLGYLDPTFFLGGRLRLDRAAAEAAVGRVADRLGLDPVAAAWGIHQVVNENMAGAARIHAVERGKDPRAYPLFAFGGAGPVHAYRVAEILRAPELIVPPGAGVASALGFLVAPLAFDYVRSYYAPLDGLDWVRAEALLREMEEEGAATLAAAGVPREAVTTRRTAELRYRGQGHQVPVPLPPGRLAPASRPVIEDAFEEVYRGLYGRTAPGVGLEALNWRVVVSGPRPTLDLAAAARDGAADARAALKGERPIYLPEAGGFVAVPVYDRYRLAPGATFAGPAVVEERESTAILAGGGARVDAYRNLIVRLPGDVHPRGAEDAENEERGRD